MTLGIKLLNVRCVLRAVIGFNTLCVVISAVRLNIIDAAFAYVAAVKDDSMITIPA